MPKAASIMIQPNAPTGQFSSRFNVLWIDTTTNLMKYWDGADWVSVAGISPTINTLKTTSNQTVNGTNFRDINELTFPVSINTDYGFAFYIAFRVATATTGFRFAMNGPAGSVCDYFMTYQIIPNSTVIGNTNWPSGHWVTYDAMAAIAASGVANADMICTIRGRVKVGATPGIMAARVASELANNDLVIQKGSWGNWF